MVLNLLTNSFNIKSIWRNEKMALDINVQEGFTPEEISEFVKARRIGDKGIIFVGLKELKYLLPVPYTTPEDGRPIAAKMELSVEQRQEANSVLGLETANLLFREN